MRHLVSRALVVVLALVGLLGSLFIRPRRVWVRARTQDGVTTVDVAALDRSNGGDPDRGAAELAAIMDTLRAGSGDARTTKESS